MKLIYAFFRETCVYLGVESALELFLFTFKVTFLIQYCGEESSCFSLFLAKYMDYICTQILFHALN